MYKRNNMTQNEHREDPYYPPVTLSHDQCLTPAFLEQHRHENQRLFLFKHVGFQKYRQRDHIVFVEPMDKKPHPNPFQTITVRYHTRAKQTPDILMGLIFDEADRHWHDINLVQNSSNGLYTPVKRDGGASYILLKVANGGRKRRNSKRTVRRRSYRRRR